MLFWAAGGFAVTAVIAAVAEQKRQKRRWLDKPGWVPWMGIQVFAGLTAVIALALAVKG